SFAKWDRSSSAGFDRGRVCAVEQVEELEQDLSLHALGYSKSLRQSHVGVDEWWSGEMISTGARTVIDFVEGKIAVRVLGCRRDRVEVESALSAEYAADLNLPRQLYEPVDLERVGERKIRRTLVEIRTV